MAMFSINYSHPNMLKDITGTLSKPFIATLLLQLQKIKNIQHTVGLFLFKKLLSQDINTNQKTVQLGQ